MQIKNIWWHSNKKGLQMLNKVANLSLVVGAIWMRMCECNLKKSKFGGILKKGRKFKKIWVQIEKCYSWIWVCLKSVDFKKINAGASFLKGVASPLIRLGWAWLYSPFSCAPASGRTPCIIPFVKNTNHFFDVWFK